MKRFFKYAAGIAILLFTAIPSQKVSAQVYGEFNAPKVQTGPYFELVDDKAIESKDFGMPPNYFTDLDDGYAIIPLDQFAFEFNGEVYNQVWISINGFVTFGKKEGNTLYPPPNLPSATREPRGLFWDGASYPVNCVAPFWGDHRYRVEDDKFQGYAPTRISYKSEADKFTVQWKNLNINYKIGSQIYKASVADFQVILYKSNDPVSKQGNIEFRYGQIGKRPNQEQYFDIDDERVITAGASVGLKGEGTTVGSQAEFVNALYNGGRIPFDPLLVNTSEALTTEWTPSGNGSYSIVLEAKTRFNIEEWWGDGDVDFSKTEGKPHFGKPQNRFVTINDARLIMKSVATGILLDSVRRRAAYHGDVNHNGRFYYNATNTRVRIPWKDMNYADNLPTEISSLKQILFEANEYDAALILAYISARVPQLPYLLNDYPQYGKVDGNNVKSTIEFGKATDLGANTYQIPVYVTGSFNGAIGMKFDVNGSVINTTAVENENSTVVVINEAGRNTVVISGNGEFNVNNPIAYVTVAANNSLTINNIRFNDEDVADVKLNLASVNGGSTEDSKMSVGPNPFSTSSEISFNIETAGYYTLAVYGMNGNLVKVIAAENMTNGFKSFKWDGTNAENNKVESGVYIYRLTGNDNSISKKVIFNK